jgi:site-specific recombinase XerD
LKASSDRERLGFAGPTSFSLLLDRFEREELVTKTAGTQRSYRDSLRPIRTYFVTERGDPTVDRVRAADVEAFLSWRRVHRAAVKGPRHRGPLHNRTLAKDRSVLHAVCAFADRLELRDGNPVARTKALKYDARTPLLLDDTQYAKLLAACADPFVRLYVLTLGETGMRCQSEALWLRWEDVDLEGGFLWVASGRDGHRTKSGKGRHVAMTPRLASAMREHFAQHRLAGRSPFVFHHTISRRHHKAGDRVQTFRESVMAAATKAKLPAGWHLHDLRHRRVTTWLAEGKNPVHVKEAMGHSDLRTTMGYTHLAREHLRALVAEPPTPEAVAFSR